MPFVPQHFPVPNFIIRVKKMRIAVLSHLWREEISYRWQGLMVSLLCAFEQLLKFAFHPCPKD